MATLWDRYVTLLVPDLCKQLGIEPWQACGIIGNLAVESGKFKFTQEITPLGGGRGGLGWAQWTGPRRRAYEAYLKTSGLPASSYKANLDYLIRELTGKVPGFDYRHALAQLKKTSTVRAAAETFCGQFEKPGVPHLATRIQYANEAWYIYQKSKTAPEPAPPVGEPPVLPAPPISITASKTNWSAWLGITATVLTSLGYAPVSPDAKGVLTSVLGIVTALAVTFFRSQAKSPIAGTAAAKQQEEVLASRETPMPEPIVQQPTPMNAGDLTLDGLEILLDHLGGKLPPIIEKAAQLGISTLHSRPPPGVP